MIAGTTGATTSGTTGTTGRSSFGVNFPLNIAGTALLDTYLLPGPGRAPGAYEVAKIYHVDYVDQDGNNTQSENKIPPILSIDLNNFNAQNRRVVASIPAPEGGSTQSRNFNEMQLDVQEIDVSDGSGGLPAQYQPNQEPLDFKNVTLSGFKGRTTAVQIFLNSSMFILNGNNTFDLDFNQFNAANTDPTTGNITGFLSDYMEFDITNVPNPPQMMNTPGNAKKLFVSGDFYALGGATPASGSTSPFEVITTVGTFPGVYFPADPRLGIKSYELQQPSPVFGNPGVITALKGTYYDYTERISTAGSTLMLAFPETGDGAHQEFVIISRNGTTITNMWFGNINYAAAGGPKFTAFPIADLQPASANNPIKGSLSGLVDTNGVTVSQTPANWWQAVRAGTWTVTSGSGLPTSSGQMVVYRI